jgi:hypothetical protein
MTMAFTIFSEVSEELSSTKEVSTAEFFKIVVVRLMCAIALHMMIEGEVYQAIQMMKFAIFRVPDDRIRYY